MSSSAIATLYSLPISIHHLIDSDHVKLNPEIVVQYIHDKRKRNANAVRFVYLFSDDHIIVLERISNSDTLLYRLFDPLANSDEELLEHAVANYPVLVELAAFGAFAPQADLVNCMFYCIAFVTLRREGRLHEEAVRALKREYNHLQLREFGLRQLNIL